MIRLTIFAALIASTAHATTWTDTTGNCYSDKCQSTGIPDGPYQPPQPKGDTDRDPQPATTEQHYGFCCRVDGVVRYHTAFGRDDATARAQCTAREIKPACPADLARMIKQADGE